MMKKAVMLIVVFALFILSSSTSAADIHVSGSTGTDNGTCGAVSAPCKTVKQGISNAGSGTSVVKIAVGNYIDSIYIFESVSGLTLQGGWDEAFSTQDCDPNLTVLRPASSGYVMKLKPGNWRSISASISCLTFRGGNDDHRRGIELETNIGTLSSVTFNMDDSIIDGFAGSGVYLFSQTGTTIDVAINQSIFKNAYQPEAASAWPGGGIAAIAYGGSKQTITLENCSLFNNEAAAGAAIYLSSNGSGSTSKLSLTNVTIAGNHSESSGAGQGIAIWAADLAQATADIINSIVWGDSNEVTTRAIHIIQSGSSKSTVNARYSIIGNVENSLSKPGTYNDNGHNVNVDPYLDNIYHLKSGSPAIDAAQCGYKLLGHYSRVAPYEDIDGDGRPGIGEVTGCDIGADEYVGNPLCFPVKSKNGEIAIICM
jgi:hypothetical protein